MVGSVWSGYGSIEDYSLLSSSRGEKADSREEADHAASTNAAAVWRASRDADSLETAGDSDAALTRNNVNSSIVAASLSSDETGFTNKPALDTVGEETPIAAATGKAASRSVSAGGGSEEDEEETITIYKTIVLPDGSKLMQIITKKPDGSVSTTTTKLPGTDNKQGDTEKKAVEVVPSQDKNTGEQHDQVGSLAVDMIEKSAGLRED